MSIARLVMIGLALAWSFGAHADGVAATGQDNGPADAAITDLLSVIAPRDYDANTTYPDGSVSVGRYLFVRNTVRGLRGRLHIAGDRVFSPQLQDQMAIQLLMDAGLDKYRAKEIDGLQFQHGIAARWDSVADPSSGLLLYGGTPGKDIPRGLQLYNAVRAQMIKQGTKPLMLKHGGIDDFCVAGLCEKYPEVLSCVAGGRPACRMAFVMPAASPDRRYMLVVTDGDRAPLMFRTFMIPTKYDVSDIEMRRQ